MDYYDFDLLVISLSRVGVEVKVRWVVRKVDVKVILVFDVRVFSRCLIRVFRVLVRSFREERGGGDGVWWGRED